MNQLPKWMDLSSFERYKLAGELIDAMIYSGEAVQDLQERVEKYRTMGWVRSVIMPDYEDQPCPNCDGAGCNECVIILDNE